MGSSMNPRRIARVLMGATLLIVATSVGRTLRAQPASGGRLPRRPITVALVDSLPSAQQQFDAVILRQTGPTGRDIILLPRASARGEVLDEATRALLHSRVMLGVRPTSYKGRQFQTLTLGVHQRAAAAAWARDKGPRAQRVTDALLHASTHLLAGVGTVPAITFLPPPIGGTATGSP